MTVDPSRLLQMLEPAVRPGNTSATGGAQQGKPAFENRSFDDLLSEAKATSANGSQAGEVKPAEVSPLLALAGFEQVENAALRNVLAQARGAEPGLGQSGTQ